MLFREIFAVCSENHWKQANTFCGQNYEFLNDKYGERVHTLRTAQERVKYGDGIAYYAVTRTVIESMN
jgi:hypothetical protein